MGGVAKKILLSVCAYVGMTAVLLSPLGVVVMLFFVGLSDEDEWSVRGDVVNSDESYRIQMLTGLLGHFSAVRCVESIRVGPRNYVGVLPKKYEVLQRGCDGVGAISSSLVLADKGIVYIESANVETGDGEVCVEFAGGVLVRREAAGYKLRSNERACAESGLKGGWNTDLSMGVKRLTQFQRSISAGLVVLGTGSS